MSEPFKTLHHFLLLHYHTFQYHLKDRKIGLWYSIEKGFLYGYMLFHFSKPFIHVHVHVGPFCQTFF